MTVNVEPLLAGMLLACYRNIMINNVTAVILLDEIDIDITHKVHPRPMGVTRASKPQGLELAAGALLFWQSVNTSEPFFGLTLPANRIAPGAPIFKHASPTTAGTFE